MTKVLSLIAILALAACYGRAEYSAAISVPPSKDGDVFAKSFLDQMQARSFAANREYCGLFGRGDDGFIVATPPRLGNLDSCLPPDVASDFNAFATYHSHGAFDPEIDSEVPSSYDLVADREDGLIGYISTPGGRVWRSADGRAELLCDLGCISVDPDFRPGLYEPIATRYTADMLRKRETNTLP